MDALITAILITGGPRSSSNGGGGGSSSLATALWEISVCLVEWEPVLGLDTVACAV
jgi:hypothetical protein